PNLFSDARFASFIWLCPACGRRVRTLYYPIAPLDPCKLLNLRMPISDADEICMPTPSFACWQCHRIQCTTSIDRCTWNRIVAYLSGGLLYGREVQKAAWFIPTRQRPYRPQ